MRWIEQTWFLSKGQTDRPQIETATSHETLVQQKESELGLWTPGSHKHGPKPQYGVERPM